MTEEFPRDFRWGAASSSYQIEGAWDADGKGMSVWDMMCRQPGRIHEGETGNEACDHYNRYREDVGLMREIGLRAYRFSVSWPRILPEGRGALNEKGLDFYDRLIDGMVARGLKVYPTLYHWDLPLMLSGDGGWTARGTAEAFAEYTDIVVRRLGDRMDALATVNEPWCICHLSHLYGIHAPGEKSPEAFAAAVHTLNLAHGMSVQAARAVRSDLPMGIVLNAHSVYPVSDTPEEKAAGERAFLFNNDIYFSPVFKGSYHPEVLRTFGDRMGIRDGDLEIVSQPLDWWGLNYYTPMRVKHDPAEDTEYPHALTVPPEKSPDLTDIGWEVYEKGLTDLLTDLYARYPLPHCFITENGACYNDEPENGAVDDRRRIAYLDRHFGATADAVDAGIPVRGYFLWSLMDNYEWAEGYRMRFGIVNVDYETQVRTLKNSALWYRDLIGAHKGAR